MPDYRRWYVPGGTVYFTLVTHRRSRLFADSNACGLLGQVMREICQQHAFETIAIVLLYDHLHAIWTLPEGDADYSIRWKKIKATFARRWCQSGGDEGSVTESQVRRGLRGVWQRRFWEHQVRDSDELDALCDYVHYNPVKHGYVANPVDWQHSTIHRWIAKGWYPPNWGMVEPITARLIKGDVFLGDS